MIVGIPKEVKDNEKRVSLTPYGVYELTKLGNKVIVEKNAGLGSGFTDNSYISNGAKISDNPEDILLNESPIRDVNDSFHLSINWPEVSLVFLSKDSLIE